MLFDGKFVVMKLRSPDALEEVPTGLLPKWECVNCFELKVLERYGWRLMPTSDPARWGLHKQSWCADCRAAGHRIHHSNPNQLDLFDEVA